MSVKSSKSVTLNFKENREDKYSLGNYLSVPNKTI